jgi:hypothetical protein
LTKTSCGTSTLLSANFGSGTAIGGGCVVVTIGLNFFVVAANFNVDFGTNLGAGVGDTKTAVKALIRNPTKVLDLSGGFVVGNLGSVIR